MAEASQNDFKIQLRFIMIEMSMYNCLLQSVPCAMFTWPAQIKACSVTSAMSGATLRYQFYSCCCIGYSVLMYRDDIQL